MPKCPKAWRGKAMMPIAVKPDPLPPTQPVTCTECNGDGLIQTRAIMLDGAQSGTVHRVCDKCKGKGILWK